MESLPDWLVVCLLVAGCAQRFCAGRAQVLLRSREPKKALCSLQAGDQRLTDTRADEQERCITIKSTGAAALGGLLQSQRPRRCALFQPLFQPRLCCC